MLAVFKKEVSVYFLTPFGYVFMGLFLLLTGVVFSIYNLWGAKGDIYGMLGVMNFVSIVIFPVLTMKLLAEEKKMATDQILFTSPVKLASIILGKYFAALLVYLVTLCSTGIFAGFIMIFGKTSLGAILGSYLGFALLGAAYIAICLFASSLTDSQVTSAIIGFGLLFGFMIIGMLTNAIPFVFLKQIVSWFAILSKYGEFASGILKIGPLVYYLSFAVGFVFLTIVVVKSRLQDKGRMKHEKD
jgi:ABC-2 type transport system permease protein